MSCPYESPSQSECSMTGGVAGAGPCWTGTGRAPTPPAILTRSFSFWVLSKSLSQSFSHSTPKPKPALGTTGENGRERTQKQRLFGHWAPSGSDDGTACGVRLFSRLESFACSFASFAFFCGHPPPRQLLENLVKVSRVPRRLAVAASPELRPHSGSFRDPAPPNVSPGRSTTTCRRRTPSARDPGRSRRS